MIKLINNSNIHVCTFDGMKITSFPVVVVGNFIYILIKKIHNHKFLEFFFIGAFYQPLIFELSTFILLSMVLEAIFP
mgnify:CR=1 FL=1